MHRRELNGEETVHQNPKMAIEKETEPPRVVLFILRILALTSDVSINSGKFTKTNMLAST